MNKILFLSNSASGIVEFRLELVQDLMKDHEVYVANPQEMDDSYVRTLAETGCKVIYTPFERRGMNPAKDYALFRTYRRIIKDIKPDMVCTYTIKPNIYGGLACVSLNVPYITNITGLGTAILGGGMLSRVLLALYRVATSKAVCIFSQNKYNMDFMISHGINGNGVVRLLPGSGVGLKAHPYEPYPSEEDGIEILSVLRLMKDKGIEELLDVIDRLGTSSEKSDNTQRRIHFTIAGRYEEESRHIYEPRVNELISQGKLTCLGYMSDMNPVYAGSHIIVHPSYHEGLSNVCLEAAACGRPVITTDIPGCKETVNDDSGLLCQPKSAESLYATIEKMLALTADERKAMGVAGRKHVEENFDRNIVISAYREYI